MFPKLTVYALESLISRFEILRLRSSNLGEISTRVNIVLFVFQMGLMVKPPRPGDISYPQYKAERYIFHASHPGFLRILMSLVDTYYYFE